MNQFYVYEHQRTDTNQVFYIGKGKGNRAFHFLNRNRHWQSVSKKSGGISVGFLVKGVEEELAFLVEMERIDQLRRLGVRLTNMTDGGEGMANPSEETLEKLSKARKGRVFSEEHKKKISEARKGQKLSDEHRKKLSESKKGKASTWKGKSPSEEARKKMSLAKLGNNNRAKGQQNGL